VREASDTRIFPLQSTDLDAIAAVHRAAFPSSALSKIGAPAVRRYYAWQLEGAAELYAFGLKSGTALAGFCFGGIFPQAISGFLDRNKFFLATQLLLRPKLAAEFLVRGVLSRGRRIFRRRRANVEAQTLFTDPARPKRPFDILSIAVHPDVQGQGYGGALMRHAERLARDNGFHAMTLVVNTDNVQGIAFYESLGWERHAINGVWQGNMEKWLDETMRKKA
jgi:ribosomal protein S18 acetylase RimI-like enzyme